MLELSSVDLDEIAIALGRAVEWLVDNSLVEDNAATRFLNDHPGPDLP